MITLSNFEKVVRSNTKIAYTKSKPKAKGIIYTVNDTDYGISDFKTFNFGVIELANNNKINFFLASINCAITYSDINIILSKFNTSEELKFNKTNNLIKEPLNVSIFTSL